MTEEYERPSREELIALCEAGHVKQKDWRNRDSFGAQVKLATARALLMAGCAYEFWEEQKHGCHWITIHAKGFNWFEMSEMTRETAYIPTRERLADAEGSDWY